MRTRAVFFSILMLMVVALVPALLFDESATSFSSVSLIALTALVFWLSYGFYRGSYPLLADMWEIPLICAVGFGFADPLQGIGFINAMSLYRQLYGPMWMGPVRIAGYVAAAMVLLILNPVAQELPPPQVLGGMVMFISLFGALARFLFYTLRNYERGVIREHEINVMATRMIVSQSEAEILRALLDPVLAVLGESRQAPAVLVASRTGSQSLEVVDASPARHRQLIGRLLPPMPAGLSAGRVAVAVEEWRGFVDAGRESPGDGPVMCYPFVNGVTIVGGLVVQASERQLRESGDALIAIAASASLALNLVRSNQRFASLIRNSSDVITILDADGIVRYQSAASGRLFGLSSGEVLNRPLLEQIDPQHHARFREVLSRALQAPDKPVVSEWRWRCSDGRWLYTESIVTNLLDDPSVMGIALNTRDVTERKLLEERLRHDASHDPLTGLANRTLFEQRLRAVLSRVQRFHSNAALMYIDIDDFKQINDSYGHEAGDRLLTVLAEILTTSIRGFDNAARLGGDEFAVLLEDLSDDANAVEVARRILARAAESLEVEGMLSAIGISIGIALLQADDAPGQAKRRADAALYQAKRSGKNCYAVADTTAHPQPAPLPDNGEP